MKIIKKHDNTICVIPGLDDCKQECVFGIDRDKQLIKIAQRGESVAIEQLDHIVALDLINAKLLFRGLQRRLMQRDNKEADVDKLIYVWSAPKDYTRDIDNNTSAKEYPAPNNAVFFVIATLNKDKYKRRYPEIYAWIEHWGWVNEDESDAGHPEGWKARYKEKLWQL